MTIKQLKVFTKNLKPTDEFQHRAYNEPFEKGFVGWVILRNGKIIRRKKSKTFDI